MGDRRPIGEREYSPLDDSLNLITSVLNNSASSLDVPVQKPRLTPRIATTKPEKVVSMVKQPELQPGSEGEGVAPELELRHNEEFVTFKFKVPRSDYAQAKRIVSMLEDELHARIDLSNLGRGWLTRLITAEKEIIDAARQQEKLKTPNPRNPLEVAEVDHAMTVVQSVAFRRATALK